MRVVLFDYIFESNKPGISGLSDVVWNWAIGLTALGDDVHIVAPYSASTRPPTGVTIHRFPVPPIGYRNILGHILIILRGWAEIRKINAIDLIHSPEYLSTAIFACLSPRIPVILTAPGNIYERLARGNPFDWSTTQVLKSAARLSARRCAAIIAISKDQENWWLQTGANRSRVKMLAYGVDTQLFSRKELARQTLGFDPDLANLVYVGRLSPEKGVTTLFDAIAALKDQIPLRIHIIGEGPEQKSLQAHSVDLGIDTLIIWHGWLPQAQLSLYYSAVNACVLPSLSEPLGRVVLEAMANRCVIIGSDVGGIADHIRNGVTGYLFPAGDVQQLAQRLRTVLTEPEHSQQIADQANAYINTALTWPIVIEQMRRTVYVPIVHPNLSSGTEG